MNLPDWPWLPNPDYRRLLQVLRREAPLGRTPFLELFADPEVIAFMTGDPPIVLEDCEKDRDVLERYLHQKIDFWYYLGYDAIGQRPFVQWPGMYNNEAEDTAGPLKHEKRRWVDENTGVIAGWEDFEHYPWPKVRSVDYCPLEFLYRGLPEGMGIIAVMTGVLEQAMWLMGYQALCLALYDQPNLVRAVFDRIEEVYVPVAEALCQMEGVIALWMGDDMGFKTGTLFSPKHLREYVLPIHKKIASAAHRQGIPYLLHSCGNLEAVMDDLIDEVGIDARHSFEDAILPVEDFHTRYSERLATIGGVDIDLLVRGDPGQVRARTRAILENCAPLGGYVLGTGNSVANYIPMANFLAMVDEGWRYNTNFGAD